MPRASRWLTLSLCLVLLPVLAVRSDAAAAPSSAPAFLASLAGEPPCRASSAASSVPGVPQNPAPVFRVLYFDCGVNCSDYACSGSTSGATCYTNGLQGTCIASNTYCGELRRSPCTCGNLCVPSGGTDDVLYQTNCCSGQAVPGSTWCNNPADWGTTWASCYQICA